MPNIIDTYRQIVKLREPIKLPCVPESDGSPWGDYVRAATDHAPDLARLVLRVAEILGPHLFDQDKWRDGILLSHDEASELVSLLGKDVSDG